jgi:hypothetical protein
VFALIQTAGFIDAHPRTQSGCFYKLLQRGVKIALSVVGTGWTRSALGSNIMADKDMALVWRQNDFLRTNFQNSRASNFESVSAGFRSIFRLMP